MKELIKALEEAAKVAMDQDSKQYDDIVVYFARLLQNQHNKTKTPPISFSNFPSIKRPEEL